MPPSRSLVQSFPAVLGKAGLVISAAVTLSYCPGSFAQDAVPSNITSSSQPALTSQEVQVLQSGPSATTAPANVDANGQALPETQRRFNYGFSVTSRGVYDDNIYISSVNRVSDFYFTIEPSISLGLGSGDSNSLSLIYRPSIFLFVDHSQNDGVQHIIHLQGAHGFGHLSLALSQDIQILDGQNLNSLSDPTGHNANIDVGQRTRHNVFTTQLSDTYDLTGKLFLSNSVTVAIDDYPSGTQIGSQNFFGNLFINYNYSPKLVLGIGATGGYNTVDNSTNDQTYEQANAHLSYTVTAKVSLSASVGIEFRQFGNNSSRNAAPVYNLSASYQPFDGTFLSLSSSSNTMNSASFAGQDYSYTTINLGLRQRFLQRMSLGLAIGYTNDNYFSTTNGTSATRNDDYYYVEPTVDLKVTRYWAVGAYFLHRQDFSSFDSFSFFDNQVGFQTTLTF